MSLEKHLKLKRLKMFTEAKKERDQILAFLLDEFNGYHNGEICNLLFSFSSFFHLVLLYSVLLEI